jgi:molybdopterin-containing oxidoreductase family iron-sulfur binding subunit
MHGATRHYWKSPAERDTVAACAEASANEFAEPIDMLPGGASRRDFLKAAGFAFAGLTLAGCSRPPQRTALPMVDQPADTTPGVALHYASTCQACGSGCGVIVKCRDGRPIKLEGNPEHALSRGGLCAVGQAAILGLYDRQRLQGPRKKGEHEDSSWAQIDQEIRARCEAIRRARGKVRVLSNTITSPTTLHQIDSFLNGFRAAGCDARHVVYDPLSSSAILDAHQETHGVRVLPHYRLDRAEVLVSFDADFLGTWVSPVEFSRDFQAARSLSGEPPHCSLHIQFEARLSLTGAKADRRHRVLPGEIGVLLSHLAKAIAERAGVAWERGNLEPASIALSEIAGQLWEKRGRSLVLCGSQSIAEQKLCNFINHLLGNYGATLDISRPSLQRRGNDAELHRLLAELNAGQVAALFLLDCNPVYDLPDGRDVVVALERDALLSVSCCERLDETAERAQYVCPHPHFLATWNDAEPVAGCLSVAQPTFVPLGNTRAILESLAAWSGQLRSARQLVQDHWRTHLFPRQTREPDFQTFWDRAVHDGFVNIPPQSSPRRDFVAGVVHPVTRVERPADGSLVLVLHANVGVLDGRHAYNPWLQELPDPITKVAWDNYVSLSPATARRLGVGEASMVRVEADGESLELPVVVQPGQHDGIAAVPLGYGSKLSERFGNIGPEWLESRPTLNENRQVGWNAAPFLRWERGTSLETWRGSARITVTGRRHRLACTQTHHSIDVPAHLAPPGQARRPIVLETTVAGLRENQGAEAPLPNLWPDDHPTAGPRWGMVIDLNACTGCSACVVACQVENNIPVVGKDEVDRQREMHWIRIDRYYSDRIPSTMERGAGGDVDVAFQPMLCHHCGNAPCETVCPVLATAHSSEGLNQQVYNRCVGTRYCANNCPYKVRRFNWFDYAREDALENLVLNPDVTVRSRGVMEKCSFCVQRIQEAKLEARRQGLPLAGMNLQTACQQSCPAQAIHFGDIHDPQSSVARRMRAGRSYQVLSELNVQPAVSYLKVVRNRPADAAPTGGGNHD